MATNDIDSANQTYSGFIASLKWAVPLIAIITLFVIMLIAE
nr:aa3-type cytochrome c oxidase subunit IV [uncultured Erythrobacter sp.]